MPSQGPSGAATFVADDHNINVMLSRQRISGCIFGDLRTMVQMKVYGNGIVGKHNKVFELLKDLWQKDTIDTSGIRFDIAGALLATTNQSQGNERNIAMVSLVINMGGKRVLLTEPYPITFVR
jgi:hypothetical protein